VLNLFADNSNVEFEPNSDLELNKYGRIKQNIENKFMDLKSQHIKEVNLITQQIKVKEQIKQANLLKKKQVEKEDTDNKEKIDKALIPEIQNLSLIKKLSSKIDFQNKSTESKLDDNLRGKQVQ